MDEVIDQSGPDVARFRARLLEWYDVQGRDLPWRVKNGTADPYRVWLSEIMLQQTTVAHATAYFMTFTGRWPDVRSLASAADSEVMAAWAGLGYYSRARNLLSCARVITDRLDGGFPDTEEGLRALPGIGPYTAAAISAFAFGRPANVVDGNVERIMARLYAVDSPLPTARPGLGVLASRWVRPERASDWPQALMDLAATVCRPKSPDCGACPLTEACLGRATGDPARFPFRAPKAAKPERFGVAFVVTDGASVLTGRRPDKGLLGGMLGLPHLDWRDRPWDEGDLPGVDYGHYVHVFTHFRLTQSVRVIHMPAGVVPNAVPLTGPAHWLPLAEADALPGVFRKALTAAGLS